MVVPPSKSAGSSGIWFSDMPIKVENQLGGVLGTNSTRLSYTYWGWHEKSSAGTASVSL